MICISGRKQKGFTLVEMIITIAITSMVLSLIYPIFLSGYKNLIKIGLNRDLKTEAATLNTTISEFLIQSKGIKAAYDIDGNLIQVTKKEEHGITTLAPVSIDNLSKITVEVPDKTADAYIEKSIDFTSKYIKNITISGLDGQVLDETSSVKVTIELYAKQGIVETDYKMSTILTFRNK